jgi:dual specificity protein kinase YAK1
MSEPELAYMTEDFDLPRWQTQSHLDPLSSSSTHAAQHTAAPPYLYPPPPPPQLQSLTGQQQRLPPPQQSPATQGQSSSRQPPRISQLLEQEQQQQQQQGFAGSSPYSLSPHTQLNRSTSLGGGSGATRSRRHHPPDDLEGAFNSDSQGLSSPRQTGPSQLQTSLYPSSVAYHQAQSLSGTSSGHSPGAPSPATADTYSDMYYNGSGGRHAPKRSQTEHEINTSVHGGGRSPMRTVTGNASNSSLIDSYAQQSQYSPTAASYASPYAPTSGSGNLPPAPYHSHSRSHSQVKGEPTTPRISSPYTPSANSTTYSPSYPMDSSVSPHPPAPLRQNSASTPNTPFPYAHPSQSPGGGPFFKTEPMQVDIPQHKRRASGFKRVRDIRDLRPFVNTQPAGRRMDSTGTYLSVRYDPSITLENGTDKYFVASSTADDEYHRYVPHM